MAPRATMTHTVAWREGAFCSGQRREPKAGTHEQASRYHHSCIARIGPPGHGQRRLAFERLWRAGAGQSGDPRRDGHRRCFRRLRRRLIQWRRLRLWGGILDKRCDEQTYPCSQVIRGRRHPYVQQDKDRESWRIRILCRCVSGTIDALSERGGLGRDAGPRYLGRRPRVHSSGVRRASLDSCNHRPARAPAALGRQVG